MTEHPIVTQLPLPQLHGYAAAMAEIAASQHFGADHLRSFAADRAAIAVGMIARQEAVLAYGSAFVVKGLDGNDWANIMATTAEEMADTSAEQAQPGEYRTGAPAGWPREEEAAPPTATAGENPAPPFPPTPPIGGTDGPASTTTRRGLRDLTSDEARDLRARWEGGASRSELAAHFNVPATSIDSRATLQGWERGRPAPHPGPTDEDLTAARVDVLERGRGAKWIAEEYGWELSYAQTFCAETRAQAAA